MADEHPRDERLAAWLDVEPLDDLTRRRLVATALDETAKRSHALRWIATAAAIAVALFGALALLTARGGNDEQRASVPARVSGNPAASAAGGSAQEKAPVPAAAAPVAAPVDLGDVGDLSQSVVLARLRAVAGEGPAADRAGAGAASSPLSPPHRDLPCRDRLPVGTITAVGSGTLDGRAAVVVVTSLAGGSPSIDAVFTDPCEVRHLA
jgi:hypothetical protein